MTKLTTNHEPRTTNHESRTTHIYAVILVGGKGKRLWPLSTDSLPKAFLSVTKDGKTMFAKTLDRIKRLVPLENIIVVANSKHAGLVRKDFSNIREGNLILEPVSRNTAPAIALAALTLRERDEDAIMAVLPTDQYIKDERAQIDSIRKGIGFIEKSDSALLVVAVKPTRPATEFGYVRTTNHEPRTTNHDPRPTNIYKVAKFVEKPDLTTAKRYVSSSRYLWNTGAFIFKAAAIVKAIKTYAPKVLGSADSARGMKKRYKKLPNISIDYAVMERADNIYCVKGSYGWQDMGHHHTLADILKKESRKFIVNRGKLVHIR